jgi:chemotaxis protein methyltransferase CheR
MNHRVFQRFCDLAYEKAGIALKTGKETLVSARIGKRLRVLGLSDPEEYLRYLEEDESKEEIVAFLDAISTNFTSFMREPDHFGHLASFYKSSLLAGQRRFRMWSAASSTGEEPYTIALTLAETSRDIGMTPDVRLLATDISTRVLSVASEGVYDEERIAPLSKTQRSTYFDRLDGGSGRGQRIYRVRPVLREIITFKRLNLSTPPFPMSGPLDIVFCRNVMIYFDNRVRQALVAEIERLLRSGGVLFIGHSETLTGLATGLRVVKPSVYQKP